MWLRCARKITHPSLAGQENFSQFCYGNFNQLRSGGGCAGPDSFWVGFCDLGHGLGPPLGAGGGGGARLRPSNGGVVQGQDSLWAGFFDLGRSLGPSLGGFVDLNGQRTSYLNNLNQTHELE